MGPADFGEVVGMRPRSGRVGLWSFLFFRRQVRNVGAESRNVGRTALGLFVVWYIRLARGVGYGGESFLSESDVMASQSDVNTLREHTLLT